MVTQCNVSKVIPKTFMHFIEKLTFKANNCILFQIFFFKLYRFKIFLSSFILCPAFLHFKMLSESSSNVSNDPESAVLHDTSDLLLSSVKPSNTPHGLFNDKYPLHAISHPTKQNILMNRISYNIRTDSYYENGIINKKYLEFWNQGALYHKNLIYHNVKHRDL